MVKKGEKMYKIGEVAEMLGVHEDTLRNWDVDGVVVADRVGTRKDRRYTAEHIRQIRELGLVSDLARRQPVDSRKDYSGYTKEELVWELQKLKEQKKYGLVWEEKTEEVVERCKRDAPILQSVPKMSVAGKDDEQRHIMIEGDNYHALEVLNYTHKGKIDVIYIDPPYNTGNKDFIFDDSYVDKEDVYRHSKWLSFMEKRLRLAKNLLSNKGVIFISIDDNEQANLKLLCDDILGEENFVANVIWQKKYTQSNDAKYFSATHDFILCYAKNTNNFKVRLLPRTSKQDERYKNPDNDPNGPWMTQPLHAKSGTEVNRYTFTFSNNRKYTPPQNRYWAFSKDTLEKWTRKIKFGLVRVVLLFQD